MRVRVKGTNWYVEVVQVAEAPRGDHIGLLCNYLTGPFAGSSEVIPCDCLVEDD